MGNKKAIFAVTTTAFAALGTFVVACGSDKAATPDAPVHLIDAMVDAPHIVDASPDASPYDFTCYGSAQGSSAPATITIAGTTSTITQTGSAALPNVDVAAYKMGVVAPFATANSGSAAAFSLDVPTATMPLDGYLKASLASYRTTYFFPPKPLIGSVMMVPVTMISDSVFGLLQTIAQTQQDDSANGVILVAAVDCQDKPISGATITVTQGGSAVGDPTDLSQYGFAALVVLNVPDGSADVGATFGSMTFPPHTVEAHKKATGSGAEGSLTYTAVRPGP